MKVRVFLLSLIAMVTTVSLCSQDGQSRYRKISEGVWVKETVILQQERDTITDRNAIVEDLYSQIREASSILPSILETQFQMEMSLDSSYAELNQLDTNYVELATSLDREFADTSRSQADKFIYRDSLGNRISFDASYWINNAGRPILRIESGPYDKTNLRAKIIRRNSGFTFMHIDALNVDWIKDNIYLIAFRENNGRITFRSLREGRSKGIIGVVLSQE